LEIVGRRGRGGKRRDKEWKEGEGRMKKKREGEGKEGVKGKRGRERGERALLVYLSRGPCGFLVTPLDKSLAMDSETCPYLHLRM